MSKKRFSDGLDDLLSNMEEYVEPKESEVEAVTKPKRKRRSSGRKNFISDLDFLLQGAMDEIESGKDEYGYARSGQPSGKQAAPGKSKSKSKRKSAEMADGHRAPLSGLDALIRQTVHIDQSQPTKKRLTVTVEKEMLKRLKTIARMENQFLKDIMARLIDEYIEEYRNNKGIDL